MKNTLDLTGKGLIDEHALNKYIEEQWNKGLEVNKIHVTRDQYITLSQFGGWQHKKADINQYQSESCRVEIVIKEGQPND